jgi:hypothetical protein
MSSQKRWQQQSLIFQFCSHERLVQWCNFYAKSLFMLFLMLFTLRNLIFLPIWIIIEKSFALNYEVNVCGARFEFENLDMVIFWIKPFKNEIWSINLWFFIFYITHPWSEFSPKFPFHFFIFDPQFQKKLLIFQQLTLTNNIKKIKDNYFMPIGLIQIN